MVFSKDFVAASATPLILSILSHGDSYGYAIISRVRELSDGEMAWTDGMLYPILHRLDKKGLIESYWGKSDAGRRRKYYRLNDAGMAELTAQRQRWQMLHAMMQDLNGGKAYV